jgi:predicted metal-dependent phosphotriesterase family hydrolase
MIGRREFIQSVSCALVVQAVRGSSGRTVNTVGGPVPAEDLGMTLMHEHVMVDFAGAREASRSRYDADEVVRAAVPHLDSIRKLGCRTFVDCTPAYVGRDAALLRRVSEASGVRIVTNTGYYAAGDNYKFLPKQAYTESAEKLSRQWTGEYEDGIDGTGIRPGLIKIGVTRGRLPELECKLVRAAALTHRNTGLPIGSHTGDGTAALHQLEILEREGVSPAAFIWIHAQNEPDTTLHIKAAKRGAWVEFDGVAEASAARHAGFIRSMIAGGCLGRTLVSQDAGWYHVGEPGGGQFRGYDFLLTKFAATLRNGGVTAYQLRTLLENNPRTALLCGVES